MGRSSHPASFPRTLARLPRLPSTLPLICLFGVLLSLFAVPARPAAAIGGAVIVKSTADTDDANADNCTLREALQGISLAKSNPNATTYHECTGIQQGINTITFSVSGTINVDNSLPDITSNIAITGPIIINGSPGVNVPIFRVSSSDSIFSLANLTLTKGEPAILGLHSQAMINIAGVSFVGNSRDGNGGAIDDSGRLNIAGSNFTGNSSNGTDGGGAIHHAGTDPLNIGGSLFNGNTARESGGAIYTYGPGNITDTIFNGNIAQGQAQATGDLGEGGGAIFNANDGANGRKMVITRSVFNGNIAAPKGHGGAIFNRIAAVVEIRDSAFNGNLAGSLNNDRLGGAIVNAGAELTLAHATFLNNAVTGDGGAIALDRGHTVSISNVTIVANAATNRGGGISVINSQQGSDIRPNLTLRNATLAQNVASSGGNYYGQAPTSSYPTPHTIGNTIFSGSDGTGGNCAGGPFTSEGHNLDSGSSCGFGATGDLQNANAALEGPSFNGGPIQTLLTMKLGNASQALDGGDPAICAAEPVANEDERGEARGGDGDGNGTGGCDIGAYEGETLQAGFGSTPVQPGPISVGNVVLGGTGSTSFTIFSTGNKALEVSNPQITGNNAADFALQTAFPISTSGSVPVTVSCTPGGSTPGLRTAGLSFSTNDPSQPTVGFSLQCNATAAPQPGYGSSPAPGGTLDVGDVALGSNAPTTLTIQEIGDADLQVNTAVIGGANPGDFSVGAVNLTIPNGGAPATVTITCAPTTFGIRSASLTLNTSDPAKPQVSYVLSCKGVPAPGPVLAAPGTSIGNSIGNGANGPYGLLVTRDGKNVYATDDGDDLLTVYNRTPSTQQISFQTLYLDENGGITTLQGARRIVEHPNGEVLYVSASDDDAVTAFRRDLATGQLTLIDSIRQGDRYGVCAPFPCVPPNTLGGMDGAYGIAVSPDGKYLYTSSINDSTISVFGLNANGAIKLGFLQSPVQNAISIGPGAGYEITLSPDGAYLYATSYNQPFDMFPGKLLVFSRNASTGNLSLIESFDSNQLPSLNGVFRVTASADGNFLYTASYNGKALTAFRRNPSTGRLTFLASYTDGAGGVDGLDAATSVQISPDGRLLFATGYNDASVAVFERNPITGLLTFRQAIKRNNAGQPPLAGARDVVVAPDGGAVYAASHNDNRVVTLQLANPRPALISLAPASVQAGSPSFTLTVNGVNFVSGAIVTWNGADLPTTFVSSGELRATVDAGMLGNPGTATLSARNPVPGGGVAVNSLTFTISAPDQNPVPSIETLIPAGSLAGGPALLLTVKGAGFIPTSKVFWNGVERSTTYVSATTLQANIDMLDVAQPGAAAVTVVSPGPGGGTSNALEFEVTSPGENPPPSISQLTPASAVIGLAPTSGLTISIFGAGFVEGSQARWNGQDRPTSFVSATELRMAISGADIVTPGPNSVDVVNPEPGGGVSNVALFTVGARGDNPVPSLSRVRVLSVNGDGTLTLELTGAGFVAGIQARWNGQDRPTAGLTGGSQVTMTITGADFAAGSGAVSVVNPAPGGGASEEVLLQVYRLELPLVLR